MKCIIVTNGNDFRIKYKWLFFWFYLGDKFWFEKPYKYDFIDRVIYFETLQDVIKFLDINYGKSIQIMNAYFYSPAQINFLKLNETK